jgi:WD40 repeat protein
MRLFNVLLKQELAMFPMDSPVRLVLFSPDGNTLAVVTDSGKLRLLRATPLERADAQTRVLRQ